MKLKNRQISLIALLTGVISFISFEGIYAGKNMKIERSLGDGKEALVEDFARDEIKDSEKPYLTRLRAEESFSVLKVKGGKIEIKDNHTRKIVELDPGKGQFTGTSSLILGKTMSKISSEKMKGIQVVLKVNQRLKTELENIGYSGITNADGIWEVSAIGSRGLNLLNYCVAVGADKFDGKPDVFQATVTGIYPNLMIKLVKTVQGPKFKADLGTTRVFLDRFRKEKASEISDIFAKYKDENPGFYELPGGRQLYTLPGDSVLVDGKKRVIYYGNPKTFFAAMDGSKGYAVGAAITTGSIKTMNDYDFIYPFMDAGDNGVAIMMPEHAEERQRFVESFRGYNKPAYAVAFDEPEGFDKATADVVGKYESVVGILPGVDFQRK